MPQSLCNAFFDKKRLTSYVNIISLSLELIPPRIYPNMEVPAHPCLFFFDKGALAHQGGALIVLSSA